MCYSFRVFGFLGSLYIEPFQSMLVAINFHGPFGLGSSTATISSKKVKKKTKSTGPIRAAESTGNTRLRYLQDNTQPTRKDKVFHAILEDDLKMIQFQLETPHEVIDIRSRMQGIKGSLESVVYPGDKAFVLGIESHLTIETKSYFSIPVSISSLVSFSNFNNILPVSGNYDPHMGVPAASVVHPRNNKFPSTKTNSSTDDISDDPFSIIHVSPIFRCLTRDYLFAGINDAPLVHRYTSADIAFYSCLRYIMQNILLKNASYASYLNDFAHASSTALVEPTSLRRSLEHMIMRTTYIESHLNNKQFIDAYQESIKLKSEWMRTYPNGYTLPPSAAHFQPHLFPLGCVVTDQGAEPLALMRPLRLIFKLLLFLLNATLSEPK